MNHDERDDLWNLLGKARPTPVSPFFSRNVLREIRAQQQEKPGAFAWLRRFWQVPALAGGIAAVAVALIVSRAPDAAPEQDQWLALAYDVSSSPDYHVIADLDELLDSEENSVWLEASVN